MVCLIAASLAAMVGAGDDQSESVDRSRVVDRQTTSATLARDKGRVGADSSRPARDADASVRDAERENVAWMVIQGMKRRHLELGLRALAALLASAPRTPMISAILICKVSVDNSTRPSIARSASARVSKNAQ